MASNTTATVDTADITAEAAPVLDDLSKVNLLTTTFWTYAGERIIKTFAYTANGLLVANGVGLVTADWIGIVSTAGYAALSSLLVALSSFKNIK